MRCPIWWRGGKANLEEAGYDFDLILPTVKSGEEHLVEHGVDGATIIMPFSTEAGELFVGVCAP